MSTSRVKDAGFLQQHLEKLVLAAGAIVLLLAIVLFVFGNPFTIEVGGQTYNSASEATDALDRTDTQLENGINNTSPLPKTEAPKFDKNYKDMLAASVVSPGAVARLSRGGLGDGALNPEPIEPPRYAMVYPPAPKDVEYKFGTDVLDTEFNPQIVNAYYALWGRSDEPADFSMFIAAGEFDIWEWVNRLKAEDTEDSAAKNKIPLGIWSRRFGIAGVALLREEWDEDSEIWTNRQIVAPLPQQSRVLPTDEAPTDPAQALANVELLRQAQTEITQPELPWVTGFIQLTPPGGVDDLRGGVEGFDQFGRPLDEENLGPTERRVKELEEDIAELEKRRQERIERQRPRDDRPDRPDRRRPPRPGDDFEDDGGFDEGPGSRGRDDGERRDPEQRKIDRLREQIERLQPQAENEREERERQAELRRERERIRLEREAAERARRGDAGLGSEFDLGLGVEGVRIEEGATVRVWAADPTMEPGKTYRYKLLVAAINPLYAVPRLESEQLAENEARAAILPSDQEIEEMDWIGPIRVEPRARFFFTSGSENKAKVDIYTRHNGVLQKENFDVSPGDPIGGVVTVKPRDEFEEPFSVDMSVGSVLIEISRRRSLAGESELVMVFMDEQGNLHERSQSEDASHPDRRVLDREIKDRPTWPLRPEDDEEEFDDGFGGPGFNEF